MPERLTVEFDHHDPEFHRDRLQRWEELRKCPVVYNPAYGGFWAVSSFDAVQQVARDEETFCSAYPDDPAGDMPYIGITGIPRAEGVPRVGVAEADPAVHQALRRTLNPLVTPARARQLQPLTEALAEWFLDQRIRSGTMDMVADFTSPVPAVITMELMGLPWDNWQDYSRIFHALSAYDSTSKEFAEAVPGLGVVLEDVARVLADRRAHPGEDLISALVTMEVEGGPLGDEEVVSVAFNLLGGGLDTTSSLTALSLAWLEQHPDRRAALAERPELLATATEEFLRYFSVNETLTRTVMCDTVLEGQILSRGDRVLLSWLSANRDETVFDRADSILFDRAPNPHVAFGVGPHRCLGMHLARMEIQVMLRQVLARIPDYRVDWTRTDFYFGNPQLNGVVTMPVEFDPGPAVGRGAFPTTTA